MIINNEINELDIVRFRNRRDVFLDNIYRLGINPTLNCNCNCKYCFIEKNTSIMQDDIYDEIYELILADFLKKNIEFVDITWFGGEPLLEAKKILEFHKRLSKIIRKNKIRVSIITNGVLLSRKIILQLSNLATISHIQVTFDGEKKVMIKKENY